ncbi:MAG TPA: hypothetical protein PK961_08315 [bacterium]|nr:hypothetical protein [bacterium]
MNARRTFLLLFMIVGLLWGTARAAEPPQPPQLPDMGNTSMQVPWSDFKDILEQLLVNKAVVDDPPPPFDAVLAAAEYEAVVREDGVSVEIFADVLVLKKNGWATLPVFPPNMPLAAALLDDQPTSLTRGDDGNLHLTLQGQGAHRLRLKLELPLSQDGGPEQFVLPVALSQVQRLTVRIGKPEMYVMLEPGGPLVSQTTGQTTVATGSFASADRVTVRWTRRAPKVEKGEARVSAEVRTMLTVGEGLAVYTAIVDYEIQHKPLSEFSLLLPKEVSVADVSTDGLVDWSVSESENEQELTVKIAFEATGRHQLAVTYEMVLPADESVSFATHTPVVRNVVREVGFLAVAVRTNVQVTPKEGSLRNFAPVDRSELPPDLRGTDEQKVLFGYKYLKHPTALEMEMIKHKSAAVLTCEIESALYKVMITEKGKQLIEATFKIANRTRQYLGVTLPPGTDLWGVYREGKPIKAAVRDGQILLPIFQNEMGQTSEIRLLAYRDGGAFWPLGRRNVVLPVVDVGMQNLQMQLYLPTRLRTFGLGGKLQPVTGAYQPLAVTSAVDEEGDAVNGKQSWSYNKKDVEKNVMYRNERSQVQQQLADIPIAASNADYRDNLARGALAVEFEVSWEGRQLLFAEKIVDPLQKNNATFFYARTYRCTLLWLFVIFCAVFVGYLVAHWLISRRDARIGRPSAKIVRLGALLFVLLIVLAMPAGLSSGGLLAAALLGAAGMLLRWFIAVLAAREKKPRQVTTPPPLTPPLAKKPEPPTATGDGQGGES